MEGGNGKCPIVVMNFTLGKILPKSILRAGGKISMNAVKEKTGLLQRQIILEPLSKNLLDWNKFYEDLN